MCSSYSTRPMTLGHGQQLGQQSDVTKQSSSVRHSGGSFAVEGAVGLWASSPPHPALTAAIQHAHKHANERALMRGSVARARRALASSAGGAGNSGTEKESPLAPRPGAVRGMSGQGGSHDDLQRLDIVALDRARESLLETSRSRWPPLAAPFGASSRAHALSAWALKTLCSSAPMRACASTFVRPTIHARDIARQCRWSALIVSATEPRSL